MCVNAWFIEFRAAAHSARIIRRSNATLFASIAIDDNRTALARCHFGLVEEALVNWNGTDKQREGHT